MSATGHKPEETLWGSVLLRLTRSGPRTVARSVEFVRACSEGHAGRHQFTSEAFARLQHAITAATHVAGNASGGRGSGYSHGGKEAWNSDYGAAGE
jgi:hypothetical protein